MYKIASEKTKITMEKTEYPKEITFDSVLDRCKNPNNIPDGIRATIANTKMALLAENVLQIDYPEALVEQVRTVDVDDTIFRIDLVKKETFGLDRICLFPHVPWKRENFFKNKRFDHGKRTETPGRVIIEYPALNA